MSNKRLPIEDVEIMFKNFSGAPDRYNPDGGNRTFCVRIEDPDFADFLAREGWNVSPLPVQEEGDTQAFKLPVKVNFKSKWPPRVRAVYPTTERLLELEPKTVGMLDSSRIIKADLELNGRVWDPDRPMKAYLNVGYFVIDETPLDIKYADYDLDL